MNKSSDEPTYKFVKGQGWVPTVDNATWYTATTKDGHLVRFKFALPEVGDGWYLAVKQETPDLEQWRSQISRLSAEFLLEPANKENVELAIRDKYMVYIVIEYA